jgi:hypothetical protein
MKRFVIAIAAVMGLAMMTGADIASARGQGGGASSGGGGGRSGGAAPAHGSGGHGGHHGGRYYGGWYGGLYFAGLGLGYGYWGWPWYYGAYPYYAGAYGYDPYPYSVYESAPISYAEPSEETAQPSLWYYCTNPAGYYPYVKNCSALWLPVVPPSSTASGKPEVRTQ